MKGYSKTTVGANGAPLTLRRVQKILAGAKAITPLANKLGKHRVTVSAVLRGKMTSAAILEACYARAAEILSEQTKGAT